MSANGWLEFHGPEDDFNILAARTMIWQAAALEIPNERAIVEHPVDGTDAARAVRLGELHGDLMAAVARGHSDVFGELAKIIAAATCWCEELCRR